MLKLAYPVQWIALSLLWNGLNFFQKMYLDHWFIDIQCQCYFQFEHNSVICLKHVCLWWVCLCWVWVQCIHSIYLYYIRIRERPTVSLCNTIKTGDTQVVQASMIQKAICVGILCAYSYNETCDLYKVSCFLGTDDDIHCITWTLCICCSSNEEPEALVLWSDTGMGSGTKQRG